jgi:asparagine synthase (glutamine-hydrolysing)
MSGIAGLLNLDGRPAQTIDIQVMARIIGHRGPDGIHAWASGPAGLGHCLLRTTPDAGTLPLLHPSGKFAITADVRLDNRKELGDLLGLRITDDTPSDAELILNAYLKWGESCPEHLLGDFAFAVWDGRNQSLFCARDHIGVRPFTYFHQPGKVFAFGSEVKAVLAATGVPFQVNEARIADYLLLAFQDKESTFFEGVLRLPPGHWLRVDTSSFTARCYWSPDPTYELQLMDEREYVEGFRDLFTEAVRCRLRSVTPIAAQLSGGLDSSFVTCVAHDLLVAQEPDAVLHTITCIYDKYPECDERRFANAVLDRCSRAVAHYIRPDQVSPLAYLDEALWYEDGPSYIHNDVMNRDMVRAASETGVRVLLDGQDGDTIVSHGWERLHELAFQGNWLAFSHESSALKETLGYPPRWVFRTYGGEALSELARTGRWGTWLSRSRGASAASGIGLWRLFRSYGLSQAAPECARRAWRRLNGRPSVETPSLMHRDLAVRTEHCRHSSPVWRPYQKAREAHQRHMISGAHATCLEGLDRIASRFGVELRHPFFDRRLVEYCLALPSHLKLRDGWSRIVMRMAMDGIVPQEVQWRSDKSNLSSNFTNGIWHFERKRLEHLRQGSPALCGYVDHHRLVESLDRFASHLTGKDAARFLWPALNLAAWLPDLEARYRNALHGLRAKEPITVITG